MPIRILSDQLASQIAAGEVVERPSSVVKELVENALDAGATTVNIDVREGGRRHIQVADDGHGIPAGEMTTAFHRHATSKLVDVAGLSAIRTLGFRGEALAAIAAVSRTTVVSRTADAASGTRLVLVGGHVEGQQSVGAPVGTVIAIDDLFFNTPARLKFLKSKTTEKRLIDEFVTRYALAYPDVRFRLTHDGRITFQTTGTGRRRDVLVAIYDPETARELLELPVEEPAGDRLIVNGFAGPPSRHWANRNHITLFVNGRWIKDNRLTYAVIQAYHTLLPTGRYPLAVLFITLPPDAVDVNVHPAKTEVRFRDHSAAFGAVQRAVRETLVADSPIRAVGRGFTQLGTPNRAGWDGNLDWRAFARHEAEDDNQLGLRWPAGENGRDAEPDPLDALPSPTLGGDRLPLMRVIGQVGAAYIIAEGPDGMFLIDQHAAHERILYEQFMAAVAGQQVVSQGLVTGTAVTVTPDQATLLEDSLDLLARLGFDIEPFGPHDFIIRSVPALVARRDPGDVILDVLAQLTQEKTPLQEQIEAQVILRVCKTAAVKAGQTLARSEMEAMVRQLEACQSPHTCPHGRPTLIHLSVAQLAREFGRI